MNPMQLFLRNQIMLSSVMDLPVFTTHFLFRNKTIHLAFITAPSSGRAPCKIVNLHCEKECDGQQSRHFIFSGRTLHFIRETLK